VVLCGIGAVAWRFGSQLATHDAPGEQTSLTRVTGSGTPAAPSVRTTTSDTSAQIGAVPAPQQQAVVNENTKAVPEPREDLVPVTATSAPPPRDVSNEGLAKQAVKSRTPTPAKPASAAAVGQGDTSGSELTGAESAPAGRSGGKIDSPAANEALAAAAENAKTCQSAASPTGVAHVSVVFTSTGQAIAASVTGAGFGGTLEGNCIAAKFRAARIPPFSGDNVTLRRNVELQ
jgi:hypothetical protein